jgi:L-fuconolactonase
MTFDAHAHLISDDQTRYPAAPLSGALNGREFEAPVTAERLLGFMDESGVAQAVAVQRAHVYGYDNSYVLDSAERYRNRLRTMCMVNALDPAVPGLISRWIRDRWVAGIRLTEPFKHAGTSWFASEEALNTWRATLESGTSLRLHFYRWNRDSCLPALSHVLERLPEARVVVDHLSNLSAQQGAPSFGVDTAMLDLVRFRNVKIMFSTINLTRMKAEGVSSTAVIGRVVSAFGAERVMWGSDIGQSAGSYADMVALAQAAVSGLSMLQQRWVLCDTAKSTYWASD